MPIYEYQCSGCNHHFDMIQKMNDLPLTTCPQCAEDKVIRLVSAAGFQLKGSGWYATDFKTKAAPVPDSKPSDVTPVTTEPSKAEPTPKVTTGGGTE